MVGDGNGVLRAVGNDDVDDLEAVRINLMPLGQISEDLLRTFVRVELRQTRELAVVALILVWVVERLLCRYFFVKGGIAC